MFVMVMRTAMEALMRLTVVPELWKILPKLGEAGIQNGCVVPVQSSVESLIIQ